MSLPEAKVFLSFLDSKLAKKFFAVNRKFPGSSEQKNVVRAALYGTLHRAAFKNGYHVVLASQECGDIKYLLQQGVSPDRIIACDRDEKALEAAQTFGVTIPPVEIANDIVLTAAWAAAEHGKSVASVNVDLCGFLSGKMLSGSRQGGVHTFRAVLGVVEAETSCFLTYIRSRDKFEGTWARFQEWERNLPKDRKPFLAIPYVGKGKVPMMVVGC